MAHVKLHERRLVAMEVRGFMQAPQRITMTILYQRKQRDRGQKKKKFMVLVGNKLCLPLILPFYPILLIFS